MEPLCRTIVARLLFALAQELLAQLGTGTRQLLEPVARARGWEVDDDDASYLVSQRVVLFWPFDEEGQMVGEDGYANLDRTRVRKLTADELPATYTELFSPA